MFGSTFCTDFYRDEWKRNGRKNFILTSRKSKHQLTTIIYTMIHNNYQPNGFNTKFEIKFHFIILPTQPIESTTSLPSLQRQMQFSN